MADVKAAAQEAAQEIYYANSHSMCEADHEEMREILEGHFAEFSAIINLGDAAVEADVLREIDSCGGTRAAESEEWFDGYNAALDAATREVRNLFARAALRTEGEG